MKQLLESDWLFKKSAIVYRNTVPKKKYSAKNRLDGKHGVGVPESEPRSRSPGVEVPESDVIKIWKTRSHMENTESDV
jgi:hypothetical protein